MVQANRATFKKGNSLSQSQASGGYTTSNLHSTSTMPKKPMMNKRLLALQEKVHLRKIQHIQEESATFSEANRKFYQRQENILLNAL